MILERRIKKRDLNKLDILIKDTSNEFLLAFDVPDSLPQGRSSFTINGSEFLNENTELVRKLSFAMQLSDPDDYEGGNLQLMDEHNKSYIAPRQRGSIILFDSRTPHRVHKVRKGERKSLVGWVVGPRWK